MLVELIRCTTIVLALATVAGAQGTIEGPITGPGDPFVSSTAFDLAEVGYERAEYFLAGTATSYGNVAPLGVDGMWSVTPAATAPFRTRLLVHRPRNPQRFNGTVVVEWLNVSSGFDTAAEWLGAHVELVRDGFAWVGVSAQFVGVEGGPSLLGVPSMPLKGVDPVRYASLVHPGDSFSYDIFSQAGQAIRAPSGPLGGLKVKRLIAAGESQSAFRLSTYVDAIHPVAHVYDGFLIHSRSGAFCGPLSEAPQAAIPVPGDARIRSDLDVPVLVFETETDLTFFGYLAARQDDAQNFRLWEVAGTAHLDSYLLSAGVTDRGKDPGVANLLLLTEPFAGIRCTTPVNSGPQHYVLNAAYAALQRWIRSGKGPRPAPRLDVSAGAPAVAVDEHGNARGGIRTPQVDAPIARLAGEQAGSIVCRLFGGTTPFDGAELATLYPGRKAFARAYGQSLKRAVKGGWVLKPDARVLARWAATTRAGR